MANEHKTNLVLLFLISSVSAKVQFGTPNNVANAAANTAVAALHSLKQSDVPNDSILVTCSFRGGSCNGAQIVLYKTDRPIFETTLTSINSFKIPDLKRHERYTLKLVWEMHNLFQEKIVETGDHVQIHLSD